MTTATDTAQTAKDRPVDFVVMYPDNTVAVGHRSPGADLLNSDIARHIPDLATQGLRHLRMWFSDTFTSDMPANELADEVLALYGYAHPVGWRGVVAISAEEEPGGEIPEIPPLPTSVLATVRAVASDG